MTAADILKKLEPLGSESDKQTMMVHGAPQPIFGVRIQNMTTIDGASARTITVREELHAAGESVRGS